MAEIFRAADKPIFWISQTTLDERSMTEDTTPSLERVKSAATQKLLDDWQTLTAGDAASLAGVRKAASEAEKLEVEIAQLGKTARSESIRFWIPIVGSLLSVLILASTLLLQTQQFRESVEQNTRMIEQQQKSLDTQRQANEDAQWREALKLMADKQGQLVNDAAGLTLLKHFATSDRLGLQARNLAVFILGYTTDSTVFQDLFQVVVANNNMEGLTSALRVNRSISALNSRMLFDINRLESQQKLGLRTIELPTPSGQPRRSSIEDALSDLRLRQSGVFDEIGIANRAVESLLRSGQKVRGMGLEKCFFVSANLGGFDFTGTNLTGTGFVATNVDDTDFSNATSEYIGNWSDTAWWRSRRMAPNLLRLLLQEYPFPKGKDQHIGSTRKQYEADVSRLKS